MNASNEQLFDLPNTGLIFQEETIEDSEHRFSYLYKRNVHIKVCIYLSDNGISLSFISNKKNKKIKKLLSTIETHLMEKIPEHSRYRMYLVTENKQIDTDIDYNVEENVYLSMVDYHYGLWGQWVSIPLMIGIAFLDLTMGKWIGAALFGCLFAYVFRCMYKWNAEIDGGGDFKIMDDIKERIMVSGMCMMVFGVVFISIVALTAMADIPNS